LSAMESSLAEPLSRLNRAAGDHRLEPFAKLDREVNARLREHMDCDLDVRVQPPALGEILRSSIRLYAEEAGYVTRVEQKGHGLQRSVIFALLRTYGDRELVFGEAGNPGRSCIFLIDEPELYLHPHLQRRGMESLLKIGAAGDQVMYSTHSPLFIDFSLFDMVRVLRIDPEAANGSTRVYALPMQRLVDDAIARNDDVQNAEAIRSVYRHACGVREAEGLFAKRVIVVEGATEAAAIPIYADAILQHSLDADSVSVVSCDGAGGIPKLCRVYGGLGIPFYPVVDWHGGGPQDAVVKKIAELFDDDPPDHVCTDVRPQWAVFEDKWETMCQDEIPGYDLLQAAATQTLQCNSKQAIAHFIASSLVSKGQQDGDPAAHIPDTIKQIVSSATVCSLIPGVLKQ
ncbi:MAG: AAA family ATPase, partial [Proteobacteria bacterium]|nr:AAA family ATPase [Pseudomonadota bacterium]